MTKITNTKYNDLAYALVEKYTQQDSAELLAQIKMKQQFQCCES